MEIEFRRHKNQPKIDSLNFFEDAEFYHCDRIYWGVGVAL